MSGRESASRYSCLRPQAKKILAGTMCVWLCFSAAARAKGNDNMDPSTNEIIGRMQAQIDALERQLESIKVDQSRQAQQASQIERMAQATQEQISKSDEIKVQAGKKPVIRDGPIGLTLGGFIDLTEMYRGRNMVGDIATSYNAIPYAISANHDISEYRGSARQSRLSLLAQGPSDGNERAEAYVEGDFFGAAPTANSGEGNGYTPRLRQAYASYSDDAAGLYVLAGQAWSLVTLSKSAGMAARAEVIPNVLDAQYVVGFNWTRSSQIRLVDKFNESLSAGVSIEGPQTSFSTGPNLPLVPTLTTNPGGTLFAPTVNYSLDVAPDVIGKIALDSEVGHFEAYGIGRWFRSRIGRENTTQFGGGVGAAAFIPVGNMFEFEGTVLSGRGVGRYASGQLPDVTVKPNGELEPIKETTAMLGAIGHVTPAIDVFAYVGVEREDKTTFTVASDAGLLAYGYGNPLYDNAGCLIEGAPAAACVANTKQLSEIAIGAYWKFYKGTVGTMQAGLQFEHIKRESFDGLGGSPSTDQNVAFFSLRYFPYQ